jgi:hypothetical protein
MDEIKFNLNKLPEFPKSVKSIGADDVALTQEDQKLI